MKYEDNNAKTMQSFDEKYLERKINDQRREERGMKSYHCKDFHRWPWFIGK